MFKRIIYILSAIAILSIIGFLIYFKFINSNIKTEKKIIAKTIIPMVPSQTNNDEKKTEAYTANTDAKIFLELFNDEVFIDAISDDLNEDGIQNPITQKWERVEEIRTSITQPKSLSFYIMNLAKDPKTLVYSGMTSDNRQVLSLQTLKKGKDEAIQILQIADLHADMQIQIREIEHFEEGLPSLSAYRVYTYNSDQSAPNTLNQIETEYTWNAKTQKYEEGPKKLIPGEKIEIQLLRKLQSGSMESFIDLSGLWFRADGSKEAGRSIYFDKNDNNIVFNLDNVEEIYQIKTTLPRRYGLFFTTNNKSIPNIIRRVELEIKGVDEIQVRVIEDVARIKFGTESLWNGHYKKNINLPAISANQKENSPEKIKKMLSKSLNQWKKADGNKILQLEGNSYSLQEAEDIETGYFSIMEINEKIILQMKSNQNINKFYLVELKEKNNTQQMTLTKIKLNINDIIPTGDEPVIFERDI